MTSDDPSNFLNQIARYGADIFQEPFSDSTRKRQGELLIASIVAILLSATVISATEGSLGGLTVSINNPEAIRRLSGFVTAYYAILYTINVIQDLRIRSYKLITAWTDMRDLTTRMLSELNPIPKDYLKRIQQTSTPLFWALAALEQERNELLEELRKAEQQSEAERVSELKAKYSDLSKRMARLQEQMERAIYNAADQTKISLETKIGAIAQITTGHRRLQYLRLFIEVAFPLTIALVALWQSLR